MESIQYDLAQATAGATKGTFKEKLRQELGLKHSESLS